MTSPLDTILQADGARQIFDRLTQLEQVAVQPLDARSYEVDDRLLNTETMFGQDSASASGLTQLKGAFSHSERAGSLGATDFQLSQLPGEIQAAAIGSQLGRGAGPLLDNARGGLGNSGGGDGSLSSVNTDHSLAGTVAATSSSHTSAAYNHNSSSQSSSSVTQIIEGRGQDGQNGNDGKGENGQNGEAGHDGYGHDGHNGTDGTDGRDGSNGNDGRDGANGRDGRDGNNGHDGHGGDNCDTDHHHQHGGGNNPPHGDDCNNDHHHGGHNNNGNSGGEDCGCDENGNLITQIIDHTAGAIQAIWPGIDQSVASLIDNTAGAVQTILPVADGALNNTVTNLGDTVTSTLGGLGDTVNISGGLLQPVIDGLSPVVNHIPGLLEQVVASVDTTTNITLPGIVNEVLQGGSNAGLLEQVVQTVDTTLNVTVPSIVETLVAGLGDARQGNGKISLQPVIEELATVVSPILANLEPTVSSLVEQVGHAVDPVLASASGPLTLNLDAALHSNSNSNLISPLVEATLTQADTQLAQVVINPTLEAVVDTLTPVVDQIIDPVAGALAPVLEPIVSQLADDIFAHNVTPIANEIASWNVQPVVETVIQDLNANGIDLTALNDTGRATLGDLVNDTLPSTLAPVLEPVLAPLLETPFTITGELNIGQIVAPVIEPITTPAISGLVTDLQVSIAAAIQPDHAGLHLDSMVTGAPILSSDLALSTIGAVANAVSSGTAAQQTVDNAVHGVANSIAAVADGSWLSAGSGQISVTAPHSEPVHIDLGHTLHHWL